MVVPGTGFKRKCLKNTEVGNSLVNTELKGKSLAYGFINDWDEVWGCIRLKSAKGRRVELVTDSGTLVNTNIP